MKYNVNDFNIEKSINMSIRTQIVLQFYDSSIKIMAGSIIKYNNFYKYVIFNSILNTFIVAFYRHLTDLYEKRLLILQFI